MALSPYQHAHDLALLIVPGLLLGGALPVLRHRRLGAGVLLAGWLGLELLVFAPVATAIAIVGATVFLARSCLAVYLAWECLVGRPSPAPREGPAVAVTAA